MKAILDQVSGAGRQAYPAGLRELLQTRSDVDRQSHGVVIAVRAELQGAHHDLAGVDADPDLCSVLAQIPDFERSSAALSA